MREITKEEIRRLALLDALEAGGVDNWDGYNFATEELRKAAELEKKIEDIVADILFEAGQYIEEPAGRGCGYGYAPKAYEAATEALTRHIGELK